MPLGRIGRTPVGDGGRAHGMSWAAVGRVPMGGGRCAHGMWPNSPLFGLLYAEIEGAPLGSSGWLGVGLRVGLHGAGVEVED